MLYLTLSLLVAIGLVAFGVHQKDIWPFFGAALIILLIAKNLILGEG